MKYEFYLDSRRCCFCADFVIKPEQNRFLILLNIKLFGNILIIISLVDYNKK